MSRWLWHGVICILGCGIFESAACGQIVYARDAGQTATPVLAESDPAPSAADGSPEPESLVSLDYLKLIWADAGETAYAPFRWNADDWREAGLIGGVVVLTAAVLDRPIRTAVQHGRSASSDRFFTRVQRFGTKQYGLPVLALFYGYGELRGNYEAQAVALDGLSASLISALVTSSIKGIVGRARPYTWLGPHHFSPFQGNYSFPSGHATGAFTFASVIATHYDSVWVDATAYGVAGLVAAARVRLDAHWTSDVIAGGLIGGLIGHHLVQFNRELRATHSSMAPALETDGQQLMLTWRF
ncbi:MAG: phosphatase PAP2 family protein [Proteobacteria bacterium]|nr:phosphatase PAP2 family protein [Pseudomonadota bacterium]